MTVIKVENLSKKYRLGTIGRGTLVADFNQWWAKARGKEDPFSIVGKHHQVNDEGNKEAIWALDDVNFEVKRGEVLGIIGKNGAGKSTLLKILSRVTAPTTGAVKIKGRIASLLEVGTGFHPDLTGRENVFLNGAILGMTKNDIKSKFGEIVDFSGVERFIDTPVKRYSSGMYVRLAFAVAAHLEPEILIIDEVLAVGDAEFQQKCLGKMKDVAGHGRTVLFVSHNMGAIQNLCSRVIYMKNGSIVSVGETNAIIEEYIGSVHQAAQVALNDRKDRTGNGAVRFEFFHLRNEQHKLVPALQCGKTGYLQIGFSKKKAEPLSKLRVSLGINNNFGQRLALLDNELTNQLFDNIEKEEFTVEVKIPKVPFEKGLYGVNLFATVKGEIADWIQDAVTFSVEEGDFFQTGKNPINPQGIFIDHSYSLTT